MGVTAEYTVGCTDAPIATHDVPTAAPITGVLPRTTTALAPTTPVLLLRWVLWAAILVVRRSVPSLVQARFDGLHHQELVGRRGSRAAFVRHRRAALQLRRYCSQRDLDPQCWSPAPSRSAVNAHLTPGRD
jgi:hypothetical protein